MKRKKRSMTLMETMVVIFIIGVIGSVIGFNMRNSLEESKAFKSREGISRLYEILQMELATGKTTVQAIVATPTEAVKNSGMTKKTEQLLRDGWDLPYQFTATDQGTDIRITSAKYEEYCLAKGKRRDYPWDDDIAP
ncbi:MAG: prepilin-type N-terminal cleavage/methylation domain-containing protein [Simkaniaceae bacterium]|nr:prepilin-type N-terminal cleavage/methylation domain-containing protein [Simkaniaceae bacterium]